MARGGFRNRFPTPTFKGFPTFDARGGFRGVVNDVVTPLFKNSTADSRRLCAWVANGAILDKMPSAWDSYVVRLDGTARGGFRGGPGRRRLAGVGFHVPVGIGGLPIPRTALASRRALEKFIAA